MSDKRNTLLQFIMAQRQNVQPDPSRQMMQVAGTSVQPTIQPITSFPSRYGSPGSYAAGTMQDNVKISDPRLSEAAIAAAAARAEQELAEQQKAKAAAQVYMQKRAAAAAQGHPAPSTVPTIASAASAIEEYKKQQAAQQAAQAAEQEQLARNMEIANQHIQQYYDNASPEEKARMDAAAQYADNKIPETVSAPPVDYDNQTQQIYKFLSSPAEYLTGRKNNFDILYSVPFSAANAVLHGFDDILHAPRVAQNFTTYATGLGSSIYNNRPMTAAEKAAGWSTLATGLNLASFAPAVKALSHPFVTVADDVALNAAQQIERKAAPLFSNYSASKLGKSYLKGQVKHYAKDQAHDYQNQAQHAASANSYGSPTGNGTQTTFIDNPVNQSNVNPDVQNTPVIFAQNLLTPGSTSSYQPPMYYNPNPETVQHRYGGLQKFLSGGNNNHPAIPIRPSGYELRPDYYMGKNEDRYKYSYDDGGGIHINPAKKGTFKAQATRMGMGIQEAANHILANKENYSPEMVKKAVFAHNFAKEMGGSLEQYNFAGTVVSPTPPIDLNAYVTGSTPGTFVDRTGVKPPVQLVNGVPQYMQQPQIKPAADPTVNGQQIVGYSYDGTPLIKHDMGGLAKFVGMYPLEKMSFAGSYVPQSEITQGAPQHPVNVNIAPRVAGNMPTNAMFNVNDMAAWLHNNPQAQLPQSGPRPNVYDQMWIKPANIIVPHNTTPAHAPIAPNTGSMIADNTRVYINQRPVDMSEIASRHPHVDPATNKPIGGKDMPDIIRSKNSGTQSNKTSTKSNQSNQNQNQKSTSENNSQSGQSSAEIKRIQRELMDAGWLKPIGVKFKNGEDRSIDGIWGPKTQAAYEQYMSRKQLEHMDLVPSRSPESFTSIDDYQPMTFEPMRGVPGNNTVVTTNDDQNYNIPIAHEPSPLKTEMRGKDQKRYGGYMQNGGGWLNQYK